MLIYLNATLVTIRGKKTDYCLFIAPMSCDNIFLEMGRSPGHLTLNRDGVHGLFLKKSFGCCDVAGMVHVYDLLDAVGLQLMTRLD